MIHNVTPDRKNGFTLIEVIVTVVIIGVLTALLIPNINRSLTRNNLAGDVQLLSSKIESARLLAGSTQQAENNDTFGYYAVYIPPAGNFFSVVRVSADRSSPTSVIAPCNLSRILVDDPACVVSRVSLSSGVTLTYNKAGVDRFIMYRAPSQQVYFADDTTGTMVISNQPSGSISPLRIKLQYGSKTATIDISSTTGQITNTTYN